MTFLAAATPRGRARRQAGIRSVVDAMPAGSDMVENILATYNVATVTRGIPQGFHWYDTAHGIAVEIGARCGLSMRAAAGIIAALSPSTDWDRNVDLAWILAETGDAPHAYGLCVERARAIRDGADPADVLGGRKVRSFFRCIAEPNREGPVCIDRHAVAIAFGRRMTDRERKILERPGAYQWVAAAYRAAAREACIPAHRLQSVTWDVWRSDPAMGGLRAADIGEF